jgi:2Fe-2S ferredoxin
LTVESLREIMPQITYIDRDGGSTTVAVENGTSVMQGAVANAVPGIDAVCGGACACATCHVYVHEDWLTKLPAPSETEAAMLEFACDVRANSRLSCQIRVEESINGLTVTVAKQS